MAEQDLTLVIKAVDDATKTLKEVQKKLKDVEKTTDDVTKSTDKNTQAVKKNAAEQKKQSVSFKDLAGKAAGVTAAIGTITAVLVKANKEFGEQNKLNQNLSRTLQNMGLNASAASTQLNLLNNRFDELSRVTNFDDEVLSQNFTKLLNVTGDLTKAQEGLQVSMDLSAMSGKSLEDTSQKILKAYNGEYMELVELGVITKEQATNFQNMANKGEATAEVMDLLSQKTKGLSENLTENEKTLREFNSDMDYLWESLGEASNNLLPRVNTALGELFSLFGSDQNSSGIRAVADALSGMSDQLERLLDTSHGDVFGPMKDSLTDLTKLYLKTANAFDDLGNLLVGRIPVIGEVANGVTKEIKENMLMLSDFLGTTEDIYAFLREDIPATRGYIPNANKQPDVDHDPEITYKSKQARKKSSSKSSSKSGSAQADKAREAADAARTQFQIEQMMEMNAAKARNEDLRMLEIEQQYQRRLFDLEQQKVSFEQQSALIKLADLEKEAAMIELNKKLEQERFEKTNRMAEQNLTLTQQQALVKAKLNEEDTRQLLIEQEYERNLLNIKMAGLDADEEALRIRELENERLLQNIELQKTKNKEVADAKAKLIEENQKKEQAAIAATISNINQASGLLQQGLGMIGGENASGLSQIVGGAAQGVTSYFSGNPMGMISGALSMAGGISSLFGQGDAARLEEERRKREEEQRKAFEAAKRERVEFQKSLQSAIVDALRESRDNLAVTYIINQSGNYLGNDNASLRQVQSALAGTGRLERNRT